MNPLLPQIIALVAVISVPATFGYLGIKHAVLLAVRRLRRKRNPLSRKEKLSLALVASADLKIYLQHSPDYLAEAATAGYDLYLAGHTHGGQVRIPGFGAVVTLSRFWKRYEAGLYREGDTYLYVNRGLGVEGGWAPRVRLFCRPEVTVIDLLPIGSI